MAWQQEALPFSAGWGGPPQLHGGDVSSIANAIAHNRIAQQWHAEQSVSNAIKEMEKQREQDALAKALQAQGLGGTGDYGYLGAGAQTLAKDILEQQQQAATQAHQEGMLGVARGHLGVSQSAEQRMQDATPGTEGDAGPKTMDKDGIRYVWRPYARGGGYWQATQWMQPNVAPQTTALQESVRPAYEDATAAEAEAARRQQLKEDKYGTPTISTEGVTYPGAPGKKAITGAKKDRLQQKYLQREAEKQAAEAKRKKLEGKYPGLSAPQDQGGGGTTPGGYKVGDPVTLKDGSTGRVTAINPDGTYQVE